MAVVDSVWISEKKGERKMLVDGVLHADPGLAGDEPAGKARPVGLLSLDALARRLSWR